MHIFASVLYTKVHFYEDNNIVFLSQWETPKMKHYPSTDQNRLSEPLQYALALAIVKFPCIHPFCSNCTWTQHTIICTVGTCGDTNHTPGCSLGLKRQAARKCQLLYLGKKALTLLLLL